MASAKIQDGGTIVLSCPVPLSSGSQLGFAEDLKREAQRLSLVSVTHCCHLSDAVLP